jgi:hypothetical protein
MRLFSIFSLIVLLIGLLSSQQTLGQAKTNAPDDVVRTKTELVQTDVTVVDKRGRFVEGLSAEDFELRVDSKLQSLSFFEQVRAGSVDEEKQLTSAGKRDATPNVITPASVADRERVIFFFVDDIHLTSESLNRARSVLTHFVENKMTAKDRVAVVSTSGQIGFLQQLTDNKAVLREAIGRLNSKYNPETTASRVSISEVDANVIANHSDRGLFAYLVEATMKEFQIGPANAANIVTNRVRQINAQSRFAELDTLSRLEGLLRSTTPLAGTTLNLSMKIDKETLGVDESSGKSRAIVDVLGIALDDRGRFASFKQKVEIPREVMVTNNDRFIKWTQSLRLPPGLYQVRVAVRDRQTGRTGSAITWIEIPLN